MALSIAIPGTQTIDRATSAKSSKQHGVIYEEIFASSATVEKVIVVDPRRSNALQIVGNLTDTFTVYSTITPGVGNDDILDAAVPWVEVEASAATSYLTGGGGINKEILAIKIISVELTGDMEICCTQMPDDE